MILVSINNIVELFFLRQLNVFSIEQSHNAVKILLLAPYGIAEKSRLYLHDECEVIPCPNLYLSKNPLKMIFMLFNYINVIKKIDKSKIDQVITVGQVTTNSLVLQHLFKLTDIKVVSLQAQDTPLNLKVSVLDTLSLSLSYLLFFKKIALVRTIKTWSSVMIYPPPLKAQLLDYGNKKTDYSQPCDRIIVIGERLYPDQSSFSAAEEKRYLRLLEDLCREVNFSTQSIQLLYYPRYGYTDRYHATINRIGYNIIDADNSFESYILKSHTKSSGTIVLALKSTCLVSCISLNIRSYQIGDLIELESHNKYNIDSFYKAFKNLNLPQLKSISQLLY